MPVRARALTTDTLTTDTLTTDKTAVTDIIELRFEQRERSRLRACLASGEEIGIDLAVGTILSHGNRLVLDDGRVVAVEAALEALLQVTAEDLATLARIAYHIGNRHVPIQVGDGWLRLLPDHVLQAMIERLGGDVVDIVERFQPEAGAYGRGHVHAHHGHGPHAHDHEGHGGRIHVMVGPDGR